MIVRFLRLTPTRRYQRPGRGGHQIDRALLVAEVDGYTVRCRARRGWDCTCDDDDCGHPDAVAALIHPGMLAELDQPVNVTDKEK